VISVLVGDEHGVDRPRIMPAEQKPAQQLAAGKTSIDQQARSGAGDQGAVPLASARQHRHRNRHTGEHNLSLQATVVTNSLTAVEKAAGQNASDSSFRRDLHKKCARNT